MKNMSKNSRLIASFKIYCEEHPEERFWQALRNWCGAVAIWKQTRGEPEDVSPNQGHHSYIEDTYYKD